MPYKNPEDKRLWQLANKDKCAEYKRKWIDSASGRLYLEKQREAKDAQKLLRAQKRQEDRIARLDETRGARALKDKRYRERTRAKAIDLLGSVCCVCGMDDPDVLEFDHIKPLLRKSSGEKGRDVYRTVLASESPLDEFQLLCANCHTKKTRLNGEYSYTPPGKGTEKNHLPGG